MAWGSKKNNFFGLYIGVLIIAFERKLQILFNLTLVFIEVRVQSFVCSVKLMM